MLHMNSASECRGLKGFASLFLSEGSVYYLSSVFIGGIWPTALGGS